LDGYWLEETLRRLRRQEPIQYVLNEAYFADLKCYVDQAVLIPRPETEQLVQIITSQSDPQKAYHIADCCTGSGCIALALANQLPQSTCYAIELSDEALAIAQKNQRNLLPDAAFMWIKADLLKDTIDIEAQSLDIVVSNPPYVRLSEQLQMQRNVLDYEPALALFVADENPLVFYQALADRSWLWLKPEGKIFIEINEALPNETAAVFQEKGFPEVQILPDFRGKPRFMVAQR
jgi:release factor glutamine methyltransferase